MTASISAPSVEVSGNSLRYGLLDIKPVEILETVRKCGLKFRRIVRKFEPVKAPMSFAEMVTQENQAIFNVIHTPERFDPEELAMMLSQRSIERHESDSELQEAIEEVRKAERKGRPLFSFVQFMKQRFESKRDYYLQLEAERFLQSNFPLSFYNKFVVFDNTYYDFVGILENIVRRYEFLASAARSFDMYRKKIGEMKRRIRPLLDQFDACSFSYSCLKSYIIVWNSKDYEEIFDPKFLDMKNVDPLEFKRLRTSYDAKLRETRGFLLRRNPEMLQKEIDPTSHTKKMFAQLTMLPSSSLRLESWTQLSAATLIGCFFLDTSIILSDILKENIPRIEKLKKDSSFHNIPCYISDSVKEESYNKVQQTLDFLGNVVRQTMKYYLEESRQKKSIPSKNPMTSTDIRALEDLFSMYHSAVRTTRVGLPSPIDLVEEWAISFLGQKLDQGAAITIDEFLTELVKELLDLTGSVEDLYDALVTFERGYIKTKTITVDSRIVSEVRGIGIHEPDCDHIASAVIHQTNSGIKTLFVTLDFSSILNNRDRILQQLGIECCGPLYGLHHII